MTYEIPGGDIGRTIVRLGRHVELALDEIGLSVAQYRALLQLAEGAEASTALARKLAVSAPSVTAVVDGLVARGAIERSNSPEDRRRVSLALTKEGMALLQQANKAVRSRIEQVALELDDKLVANEALAGLSAWATALDAHRARRLAQRNQTVSASGSR